MSVPGIAERTRSSIGGMLPSDPLHSTANIRCVRTGHGVLGTWADTHRTLYQYRTLLSTHVG
eukprot:2816642-Rhodomonas_salina.2